MSQCSRETGSKGEVLKIVEKSGALLEREREREKGGAVLRVSGPVQVPLRVRVRANVV